MRASKTKAGDARAHESGIDGEEAARAGGRRRRRQRFAVAGAFGCVVAAAATFAVLRSPAGHDRAPAMTTLGSRQSASPAGRIGGRWLATSVDGNDISSWRDLSGRPATIIIGADRTPDQWQVNRACGPLVGGDFVVHPDGSVTEASPPVLRMQSCPNLKTAGPDLVGVIGRTAFVVVDPASDPAGRTMSFLDHDRKLIARWRADPTFASPAAVCASALGPGATADGGFTTVQRIRDSRGAAATSAPEDVFPHVPGEEIAVYCRAAAPLAPAGYAVTVGGQKERLR